MSAGELGAGEIDRSSCASPTEGILDRSLYLSSPFLPLTMLFYAILRIQNTQMYLVYPYLPLQSDPLSPEAKLHHTNDGRHVP